MAATKETPRWFVGESQLDYQEWGFDGTVWEMPTQEEMDREIASEGKFNAEPYLVAEHIRHEEYARLIAAAPSLLAACEALYALAAFPAGVHPADRERILGEAKAAIAAARP